MAKYYFTTLAARPMILSGRKFVFLVCSNAGGRANGVYKAETEEEISILDAAVAARRGVKEIPEEEYEFSKKKGMQMQASSSSVGFKPRVIRPPILPQMAVEAADGVPSAGVLPDGRQRPAENLPPSPTVNSIIRTSRVNSPKPFAASEEKIKKAAERAQTRKAKGAQK